MRSATIAAGLGLIAWSLGAAAGDHRNTQTHTITIESMRFQPEVLTVALGDTVLGALIGCGADPFGGFELDQLLQRDADRITDQIDAIPGTERLEELGQGRLGQGHRWTSFFDECLAVHTEDPADGPLRPRASPPALKPHHSRGLSCCLGRHTRGSRIDTLRVTNPHWRGPRDRRACTLRVTIRY